MRSRKIGPAHASEAFLRNAEYRGYPELRCGQRVVVTGKLGVIVGHNSSANLEILFDETGEVLSVHPDYAVVISTTKKEVSRV